MSLDDFCRLRPEELDAAGSAWSEARESEVKGSWERMRTLACIAIQPHVKDRITPETLLPFDWDAKQSAGEMPSLSREDHEKRFRQLIDKRMKDSSPHGTE